MFVLFRAIVYATLFIGFFLVFVPAWVLSSAPMTRPASTGTPQVAGLVIAAVGSLLALWCILTFAFIGKGTPAIFDPPRRLVVRGPYRFVRNPMYIGAGLAVSGAALYYRSVALFAYAVGFWLVTHLFVIAFEEPTLLRTFQHDYDHYRRNVSRWWPRVK